MFESIIGFFRKLVKSEQKETNSKETAKERLHLVLMQDRANVSADFLELMKQEIIEVIKKYIDVQEEAIDVRLTNEVKEDGTTGAPSLYANIPIINIKKKENVEITENKLKENKTQKVDKDKSENQSKEVGVDKNDDIKTEVNTENEKDTNKQIKEDKQIDVKNNEELEKEKNVQEKAKENIKIKENKPKEKEGIKTEEKEETKKEEKKTM